jgi:hypothetical protein
VPEQIDLHIRRLRTGSVFRLVAAGSFFSLVPLAIMMGVFALFGFKTVTWNKEPLMGLTGLLASPLIGVFIAAFLTAFLGSLISFCLWLYSKIKPLHLTALVDTIPKTEA